MNSNLLISIGRQYGSGGREIGEKLAAKLGIAFYNNELITLAAQKSGMAHNIVGDADERRRTAFCIRSPWVPPTSTETRVSRSICR